MASEIDHVSSMHWPLTQVPDRQPDESTGPVPGVVADPGSDPDTDAARADAARADAATADAPTPDGPPSDAPMGERMHLVPRRTRMVPIATFEVPGAIRPIPQPDGWTDVLTGTDGPRFWDRIVLSEQARVGRYHRPVTVAFAEIVGLTDLAGQWGWDVSERALAACARRLGREIRSSDHIARLEQARFGILLTETTEIAAINFVERARASCERELKAVGNGVPNHVAIGFGWASPPAKGDLSDAIDLALARLAAELAIQPAD
jgi:diguanylate cyclase (GGDEF)-like protein